MNLTCWLKGHEPSPAPTWDAEGGYHVSTCMRCGAELTRGLSGQWKAIPLAERHRRTKG